VESLNSKEITGRIEAIIFASGDPISVQRITQVLNVDIDGVLEAVDLLKEKYNTSESGIHLITLESMVQFTTNPAFVETVRESLDLRRNTPLSQAALEVLAVIAYNQPVTKAFVEQVRGVDCSGVVGSLVQKELLEERGRLELPGRPLLYGTTEHFLRCMEIESISQLPELPKSQAEEPEDEEKETKQISF
jgi:segregation and condensation protein B